MNNSQNSQNSQQSPQQNQLARQSSVGSQNQNQNMQGNQLQAQMQALSQSAMAAMNDNSNNNNNNNNNQMQQLQNQMQNQMQQMQNQVQNQMDSNIGGDLDPFGSDGVDQVDKSMDPMGAQQGSNTGANDLQQQQPDQDNSQTPQEKEDDNAQTNDASNNANGEDSTQPMSQKSSDDDKGKAKRRTSAKARPTPAPGGRGKGARGRGGKGKRLRDIADDLGASSRLGDKDDEGGSKKRGADEMSGGDGNDSAAKSSKTDPVPDSEKSQGSGKDGEKDGDSSLTSSMPKGDVEQHLLLLHKGLHLTSRTITHKCLPIVQQLIDDPFGWVFRDAVDPVVFGLPDYFEVVKNPMHLRLVKKKLENAVYTDMASFERDVKLVFENAILYNGEESEVGQLAKSMMGVFEREYKKVCEGM